MLIQTLRQTFVLAAALAVALGLSYVATAWTGPTAPPPGNNVAPPINVGAESQVKAGGLGVTSLVADQLCLGADCITAWGGASGGGVLDSYSNTVSGNGAWSREVTAPSGGAIALITSNIEGNGASNPSAAVAINVDGTRCVYEFDYSPNWGAQGTLVGTSASCIVPLTSGSHTLSAETSGALSNKVSRFSYILLAQ